MSDVAFNARLDQNDWNSDVNGWRCPALKIPGAQITQIFAAGKPIDQTIYQVTADQTIRWIPDNPPAQINVLISLTKSLSLRTETDFWKKLTVIVPIIAALISGFVTYTTAPSHSSEPGHLVHFRIEPIDLGKNRTLPEPLVTINGQRQDKYPISYVVAKETTAIVDVTDAMNFVQEIKTQNDRQRQTLSSIASSSGSLAEDLQSVQQIISNNCSGGSNGIPARSNPAVLSITSKAATTLENYKSAASEILAATTP